jgi:hypothetical protein
MTRDQLTVNIANTLKDAGLSFFTSTDINNAIQDGYDEISAFCHQIDATGNITLVVNKTYYNVPTLLSDFLTVVAVYNNNTKRWLDPTSPRILRDTRWDWENWIGEPKFFFPHSWEYIGIAPKPGILSANPTLTLFYRAQADTLASSSIPKLNTNYNRLIESYAVFDLLTQAREYKKAQSFYKDYIAGIKEYKCETKSFASSDRIYGLRG